METGQESPMGVTSQIWYRGVSMMITRRSESAQLSPLIEKQMQMIDWLLDVKQCKPKWDEVPVNTKASPNTSWLDKPVDPPANLGTCPRCGGPNAWSVKKAKEYCKNLCWKK